VINVSEIGKALGEIKACEQIVRPYEYTAAGRAILEGLNRLRGLLKTPSKTNIDQCISIIEKGEDALGVYRYMSVVEDLLKHLSKLKEHLKKAKERLK